MEKDPEMKGDGNSYTTEFRQYDPRLGRWLSLDPMMQMFPSISPYVAFDNNPIMFNDPTGLKSEGWGGRTDANGKTNYIFDENITADNYKTINGGYDSYMEGSEDGMIHENSTIDNGPKGTVLVFNDGKAIYFTPGLEADCIGKKKPKADTESSEAWTMDVPATDENGKYSDGHGMFYNDPGNVHREAWDKASNNSFQPKHLAMFAGVAVAGGIGIYVGVVGLPLLYAYGSDVALYGYMNTQAAASATVTSMCQYTGGRIVLTAGSIVLGSNLFVLRNNVPVYRVFGGGPNGASQAGYSWTPVNPSSVNGYRNAAGLPSLNTATNIAKGVTNLNSIVLSRSALPIPEDGVKGGLTEFFINPYNVKGQTSTIFTPKN